MKIRPGVTGIWLQPDEQESPTFTWQSQWIWIDETIESDVMLARRSFGLDQVSREALIPLYRASLNPGYGPHPQLPAVRRQA